MDTWAEILSIIGGVIAGAIGGSLITVRLQKKKISADNGSTVVDQSNAQAGGDIVGGNKKSKS
jgi:hypothetical protein